MDLISHGRDVNVTRAEVTIALMATRADEGGLSDVNGWMARGSFSVLVGLTEPEESHSVTSYQQGDTNTVSHPLYAVRLI